MPVKLGICLYWCNYVTLIKTVIYSNKIRNETNSLTIRNFAIFSSYYTSKRTLKMLCRQVNKPFIYNINIKYINFVKYKFKEITLSNSNWLHSEIIYKYQFW